MKNEPRSLALSHRISYHQIFSSSVLNLVSAQFLEDKMHPTVIIQAFRQALEDMVAILGDEVGVPVNMDDEAQLIKVRLSIYSDSITISLLYRDGLKSGP